ncbi:RNA polymerase II transcription factor B 52 kDa subunit [Gurleya vavrai]
MIGLVVNLECEYKNYKENQIQGFCSTDKNTKFNKNSLITKAVKITDFFKFLFSKETTTNLDFLIIEANFKFYAKTTLEHQKSILKLFTSTKYELPGFVIGQLSEESVNDAFSRGITAKQITHYIKSISKNIPDVVIEQIQIWEEKKNRLKSFECIMLSGFLKAGDFKKVADFCKNKIYTNEEKRILFIKIEEFEMIKEFIKKLNL